MKQLKQGISFRFHREEVVCLRVQPAPAQQHVDNENARHEKDSRRTRPAKDGFGEGIAEHFPTAQNAAAVSMTASFNDSMNNRPIERIVGCTLTSQTPPAR